MSEQSKTEKLLDEISKSASLSTIFGFYSNEDYAIEDQNIFAENKDDKEINWLYVSDMDDIQLIGVKKDGKILFGHEDGTITNGSEDFFNIPFVFYRIYIKDKEKFSSEEIYIKVISSLKNKMIEYVEWCKKNNITLKKEDLDMLNDENSQKYNFWKGDKIIKIEENQIFTFGSNPAGIHGAGAAKVAVGFGAKYGVGRGLVGSTYALVTKNLDTKPGFLEKSTGIVYEKTGFRSVSEEQIRANIKEMYEVAKLPENQGKEFLVTYKYETWPNGTPKKSLNGYTSQELLEMFVKEQDIPNNIVFHESYKFPMAKILGININEIKREKMAEIKQSYDDAKENGTLTSRPVFSYEQAILKDNQPRENFTFFWHTQSPFSQWHPAIFEVKGIRFTSCEQFMMFCKAKLFNDDVIAEKILSINNSQKEVYINGEKKTVPSVINLFYNGKITTEEILKSKELKIEWGQYQKQIKDLGRLVKGYNDDIWVKHRESYVGRGNYEKFSQNKVLQDFLINTGNTILVEASPYDGIWGNKLNESDADSTSPSKWKGLNLLGKILTNLREKLKLTLILGNEKKEDDLKQKPVKRMKP